METQYTDPESFFLGLEPDRSPPPVLFERMKSGFLRLITEARPHINDSIEITRDAVLSKVRSYLSETAAGDERGPSCPFVRALEKENGYFVMSVDGDLDRNDLPGVLALLEEELDRTAGYEPSSRFPTVVAAFTHPEMLTEKGLEELEAFRKAQRGACLERGLTLAITHPDHPVSGNEDGSRNPRFDGKPLFVAELPQLLLRNLHPKDRVFMHSEESMAQFERGMEKRT